MIQTLADLGACFDCASPAEIDAVLATTKDPSRILYANPCKRVCDIKYAMSHNIHTYTFDNVAEIKKVVSTNPYARLVLRIYANDPNAQCILSNKFGAHESEWDSILTAAKNLNANLVGISFHVGSGASSPEAFTQALAAAARLQAKARDSYGYSLNLIDIGGGFSLRTFPQIATAVREAIAELFVDENVRFIAEPGRFFAETAADFYTPIIGMRSLVNGGHAYTIADGLYGSFNCILYDHAVPHNPEFIRTNKSSNSGSHTLSVIFGPTCDGLDQVASDCLLPELDIGDFLVWRNFGAYTISGASHAFNGIPFYNIASYIR
jgi:ornithine decarboxylase